MQETLQTREPLEIISSSTIHLPTTPTNEIPPELRREYEETESGLAVPSQRVVRPLSLIGSTTKIPIEPVHPSGKKIEDLIADTSPAERKRIILEFLGMTPADLVPYPTLDKNDRNILSIVDGQKFFSDFRYVCESFFWIPTKEKGIIPFQLNPVQIFYLMHRYGRDIILKARQHGFTTLMLALYLWDTMTTPATTTFVVAHDKDAAEAAVTRMRDFYECLPKCLRPKLKRDRLGHMMFEAIRSEIRVQLPSDAGGRSFTCNNLFCTEVAFWDIEEEKISGLLEAVPVGSGGSITWESTPNGVGNLFHKQCSAARLIDGESQFKFFCLPWYLNFEYDEEWEKIKKEQLQYNTTEEGKRKWNQEYCCSFEQSQRNYFEKSQCIPRASILVRVDRHFSGYSYPKWCWIYQEPLPGDRYVIGADTSQGIEGGDYSCGSVLSRRTREEVATIYGRPNEEDFARMLYWMGRKYNLALLGVEAMGSGHTVLHILFNELFYPNLFFHPNEYAPNGGQLGSLGWQTNRRTRPTMLAEMRKALTERSLKTAFNRRQMEMEVFRLDKMGKPTAPSGFNDDTIMSMAIAHRLLDFPDMIVEEEMDLSISAVGG